MIREVVFSQHHCANDTGTEHDRSAGPPVIGKPLKARGIKWL